MDSIVSSPGAYGALSAIYAALAVPAALFPHSVCVSVLAHLPGILHCHTVVTLEALGHELGRQTRVRCSQYLGVWEVYMRKSINFLCACAAVLSIKLCVISQS